MIGRLVRPADFERVLGTASRARTPHFTIHHVGTRPSAAKPHRIHHLPTELSTGVIGEDRQPVDEGLLSKPADRIWLGTVVPKRLAKRAVTRSLLKRQIRAAVQRHLALDAGLWVIRLRAPFDAAAYRSAASEALRRAAHAELDTLLGAATKSAGAKSCA